MLYVVSVAHGRAEKHDQLHHPAAGGLHGLRGSEAAERDQEESKFAATLRGEQATST